MAKGKMFKTTFAIAGKMDGSLKKAFDKAQDLAKKTGAKIKSGLGKAVKVAGTTMVAGATAATLAIGGMGVAAIKNAAALETQMQNVGTLLDGTATEVAARTSELSEDIIKVSNSTGIATSDLTAGLYDVISAIGDSEDSVKVLETSAKAAAAGNASTAEAVSLLTAVTKGYGDTSGEAFQKASDLAFQTVKLGQTTFPELAASIGKVTPLASALGVEQEELFGVFATLTGVTGGAAEVSTQYKGVLAGLMQPSEKMSAALKSLGYETGSAAIEALGFQGTLDALQGTTKGNVQETAKLFSSVEAQTAVLSLCGAQADNLTAKTQAMYEANGIAGQAFDTQTASLEYTLQRMKNLGSNFLTSIGTKLLPVVADFAEKMLPNIENALDSILPILSDIIARAGPGISKLASGAMPLLMAAIKNIPGILQKIIPIVSNVISQAMPLVSNVITRVKEIAPVIMDIIQRLIAGGMNLYNALAPVIQTLIERLSPVFTQIMPVVQQIIGFIGTVVGLIGQLSPALTFIAGIIGDIAAFLGGALLSGISWVIEQLTSVINTIREVITMAEFVIGFLTGTFQAAWNGFWSGLGSVVSSVVESIKGIINRMLSGIVNPINSIIRGINKIASAAGISQIPLITVPAFAKGGTVTSPTLALVGEGRDAETIVPHNSSPRSRALLQEAAKGVYGTAGSEKQSTKTYNITYAPTIIGGNGTVKEELEKDFERFKAFFQRQEDEFDREVFA